MIQLEQKFYKLSEIREILGIKPEKSKGKICNYLEKHGYTFNYINNRGVFIQEMPDLFSQYANILEDKLELGERADIQAFAAFFLLLKESADFRSMPNRSRAHYIKKEFNISVSERSINNFVKKLKDADFLESDAADCTYWYTKITDDRPQIQTTKEDYDHWYSFVKHDLAESNSEDRELKDSLMYAMNISDIVMYKIPRKMLKNCSEDDWAEINALGIMALTAHTPPQVEG